MWKVCLCCSSQKEVHQRSTASRNISGPKELAVTSDNSLSQEVKEYQVRCVLSFQSPENTISVNQLTERSKSEETDSCAFSNNCISYKVIRFL